MRAQRKEAGSTSQLARDENGSPDTPSLIATIARKMPDFRRGSAESCAFGKWELLEDVIARWPAAGGELKEEVRRTVRRG